MGYTSVTWTRSHLVTDSSNHGGHTAVTLSHSIVTHLVSSVSTDVSLTVRNHYIIIFNDVDGLHLGHMDSVSSCHGLF